LAEANKSPVDTKQKSVQHQGKDNEHCKDVQYLYTVIDGAQSAKRVWANVDITQDAGGLVYNTGLSSGGGTMLTSTLAKVFRTIVVYPAPEPSVGGLRVELCIRNS
jgi:hypothetical protein